MWVVFWCVVCHAEMNAIMNKNSADVKGCTIYVALFPCNECAKLIIQVAYQLSICAWCIDSLCEQFDVSGESEL